MTACLDFLDNEGRNAKVDVPGVAFKAERASERTGWSQRRTTAKLTGETRDSKESRDGGRQHLFDLEIPNCQRLKQEEEGRSSRVESRRRMAAAVSHLWPSRGRGDRKWAPQFLSYLLAGSVRRPTSRRKCFGPGVLERKLIVGEVRDSQVAPPSNTGKKVRSAPRAVCRSRTRALLLWCCAAGYATGERACN